MLVKRTELALFAISATQLIKYTNFRQWAIHSKPSTMGNSPQPSTMGNSPQPSTMDKLSVTYQHGTLQTDISNLQTSEVEILEINWSDKSSQEEYTCCRGIFIFISQISKSEKTRVEQSLLLGRNL